MNKMRVFSLSTLALLSLGVLTQSCGLFGGGGGSDPTGGVDIGITIP